jgi:hypothetical protein
VIINFDIAPDGRFLVATVPPPPPGRAAILVENWNAARARR